MFHPLSDEEKKAALRDGALGAIQEARRRQSEIRELQKTARAMFQALISAPRLGVQEAPLPQGGALPTAEGWKVTPKVTQE